MKSLVKYYIGFSLLLVLTIVLCAVAISQGKSGKNDEETAKKIQPIGDKVENYIYDNNVIPESLAEAGVTDAPSTVKYEKIDEEHFKFCVHFDKASSSFDAGPFALITGLLYGGAFTYEDPSAADEEKTYLDTYTLSYNHKAGENCQTVKPTLYSGIDDNFEFDSQSELNFETQEETLTN